MFSPWEERGSEAGLGEAGQAGMKDQLCDPNPGHLTWCSVPGSVSHCGQAELQLLWLLRACCNGHWEARVRGLPDSYVLYVSCLNGTAATFCREGLLSAHGQTNSEGLAVGESE